MEGLFQLLFCTKVSFISATLLKVEKNAKDAHACVPTPSIL